MYKYGVTYKMHQRTKAHRKHYGIFEPVLIMPCHHNRQVEAGLKTLIKERNANRHPVINGVKSRELVATSPEYSLVELLEDCVDVYSEYVDVRTQLIDMMQMTSPLWTSITK